LCSVFSPLRAGRSACLPAGAFTWDSDLAPALGGHNEAPSPVAYLLGGLAGCAVAFLANTLAPQFGVEIEEASATARCVNDLAGVLGVEGTDQALTGIAVEIPVSAEPAAAGGGHAGGVAATLPRLPRAPRRESRRRHLHLTTGRLGRTRRGTPP
jgi:hypothetical protein